MITTTSTMNEYVQELIQRIDNRYSLDTSDMTNGDWICKNTHLRGRPFSFQRYPFQEAIANDMHPSMDVVKPSQVGLSEIQIRKALAFITRNRGTNLIFTLPTDPMFERMSTTRVLPLVKEEKVFNLDNSDKPSRRQGLVQVGSSFLFMTGAKEGDATSISADVVMNDEVDLTDQQMLALFASRLQNSDWKIHQRFSTPTFVNFGIDLNFKSSDQHEYLLKCDACNHWQAPLFNEKFIELPGLSSDIRLVDINQELYDSGLLQPENSYVCCEKCRAPLDLGRTENREWVGRYMSRVNNRGYRVSPFSTDRLSPAYVLQQMLNYKRQDHIRGWHNTVLGRAFTAANAQLSDDEIKACFTTQSLPPPVDRRGPTWIGVDMGLSCHLIVSQGTSTENQKTILFKVVPVDQLLEVIKDILDTYNVIGGGCDRHPYTPTANALFEISNGRILPIEYRGEREMNFIKDPLNPERILYAQANRTILIDLAAKVVRRGLIQFQGYGSQQGLITEQLKDMIRDETPEKPAVWLKQTGNDHYFHALGFLTTGIKLRETFIQLHSDLRSHMSVRAVTTEDSKTTINRFPRRP